MRVLFRNLGFAVALAIGAFGFLLGFAVLGGGQVTSKWPAAGPGIILAALVYVAVLVRNAMRSDAAPLKRLLLAFVIAPFLPATLPAVITHLNGAYHPLAVFILFAAGLYAMQIVVGLPAYVLFNRAKRHPFWAYALIGFCAWSLPCVLLILYRCPEKSCSLSETTYDAAYIGMLGAATAAIFWWIARPNQSARVIPPRPSGEGEGSS